MSVELNSMIDGRSSSTYADAQGSEPVAGNESEVPVAQIPREVGSMCGSNAAESVASVVGLSFPSSDGAICSGFKAVATTGTVSWM